MKAMAAVLLWLAQDDLEALGRQFEAEKDLPAARRADAIGKIGALRTDEAAGFLGKAFAAEKDLEVRRHVLSSLAACGTEAAVRLLVSAAKGPEAPLELREAAVEILGGTSSRQAFDFLVELARSGGPLRARAFAGLASRPLAGTEALWRAALEDPDPEIRRRAFRMLAPLKDRKVLDLAKKAIQDRIESSAVQADAVAAWRAQGGVEAVKVLLPAAANVEAEVRAAIAEALGTVEGDKAAEAVYEGLRDPSRLIRLAAVGALAGLRHARAMQHLDTALRDREVEVRLAAVDAIAARRDRKSEDVLRREAQKSEGETVFAAIRALGGYPSEEALKLLGKLATQGGVETRVTALETLGDLARPDSVPFFAQALKSREWPVRVVAVRQLARLKAKESVDLLVERMPREEGRLLGEIAEALRRLTGKGPISSPVHWKDWWAVNRETFAFGAAEAPEGGVGVTTYHGVPVISLRIIFCLDFSGSMESPVGAGGETRLAMAKKELSRALSSLDRAAKVNLVFFDDRVEPWMRELVPAKANLPRALALIDSVKPRGATNVFDTLDLCFQDASVDTVYILSDGEPNMGKFVDAGDILREIRRMNRARQIVIHAISLGPSDLMRKLAEQNGGQYVEKK